MLGICCFSSELLFNVFGGVLITYISMSLRLPELFWNLLQKKRMVGISCLDKSAKIFFSQNLLSIWIWGFVVGKYLSNVYRWVPLCGWRSIVCCSAGRINSEQVGRFLRTLLFLKGILKIEIVCPDKLGSSVNYIPGAVEIDSGS